MATPPMPTRTSNTNTDTVVARHSTSSLRRKAAMRRSSATSINRTAAKMTTAASAAVGNVPPTSGPSHSKIATTSTNDTRECSWVRAPMVSAITVRLPLELIGKPCSNPLARFAPPPSARNSCRLSIRS